MDCYIVGGAVRDALLGLPVHDRDWVVVGSTVAEMLAAGFQQVGRDFPVFLHPHTHEEYALARTERKTAAGYQGFVVHAAADVSLEEDLQRRDLTINAMAQDGAGTLIDPYGGQRDLHDKVLRHVGPAFVEDPVRILRLARFAARFPDFRVADETLALMRQMVAVGEVDALVAERVWQELARGLMADCPSRMLTVLRDCGALARLLPELDALWGVPQRAEYHPEVDTGVHTLMALDQCVRLQAPLAVRFAVLCHDLGKGQTPPAEWPRHIGHEARSERLTRQLCQRLKPPTEAAELALLVAREHTHIHGAAQLSPAALMRLIERCDGLRRPERFALALLAGEADARGRLGFEDQPYPSRTRLTRAMAVLADMDSAAVTQAALARGLKGPAIAQALHQARIATLSAAGI